MHHLPPRQLPRNKYRNDYRRDVRPQEVGFNKGIVCTVAYLLNLRRQRKHRSTDVEIKVETQPLIQEETIIRTVIRNSRRGKPERRLCNLRVTDVSDLLNDEELICLSERNIFERLLKELGELSDDQTMEEWLKDHMSHRERGKWRKAKRTHEKRGALIKPLVEKTRDSFLKNLLKGNGLHKGRQEGVFVKRLQSVEKKPIFLFFHLVEQRYAGKMRCICSITALKTASQFGRSKKPGRHIDSVRKTNY